ncbi:MAG TPA: extracellular solute-binding protein, partial [Planctomycetota bacterium]|nr:extracellular solute-binding protein [Planctomycetota bacterium]
NELLGTMDLDERGLLEPYKGPGWQRMPAEYKDPGGRWTGFAARLRVYIVNREKMTAGKGVAIVTDADVATALGSDNLSRAAIAKPLYGTTLTHYCVLWEALGADAIKTWHRDLRARGIREVAGNATVKDLVADGVCDFGFTDTDDFFVAKDAGKPVEMLPVTLDDGRVIAIPNTVCIIKGTSRGDAARRLVDYLLSGEIELKLANSKSRQVPLGPVDETKLPEEVRVLKRHAARGFPLTKLTRARRDCLQWLKSEYLK